MATRVDYHGRLDGKKRTPQGGLRIDANLTRTGIFLYQDARGGIVREYRPPEEVFNADSLETLKLAPLTVGHPAMVRTDNYQKLSVGTVAENVRARDQFVASDVLVQDRSTIDKIEDGSLVELSCGYDVDLEMVAGVTPEGEHYDAIQRNIRYNHVGLGGPGWGRAGSDVSLKLDGADTSDTAIRLDNEGNAILESYAPCMSMTAEEKARLDRAEAAADAAKLEIENLKKSEAAAKAELERVKTDTGNQIDRSEIPAIVAARVQLESSARAVLGADFDTTKADAKDPTKRAPLEDSEIVAAVLAKADPDLKIDGRSNDYLRARFDAAVAIAAKALEAHAGLNVASAAPKADEKTDGTPAAAPKKDAMDEALEIAEQRRAAAAKAGPPAGAVTRR